MASSVDPPEAPGVSSWETLAETEYADCRVFRVLRRWERHPQRGTESDFFVIDSPDWVNVLAVTDDGSIVMVTQYRFGSRELSLEIPGGIMDAGEEAVAAARRELREETGFEGGEARLLGRIRPNPAIQNNHCHLVLIEGVRHAGPLQLDEHEEIHTSVLAFDRALTLARAGSITHALTLNAFFLYEPLWQARSRPI